MTAFVALTLPTPMLSRTTAPVTGVTRDAQGQIASATQIETDLTSAAGN